MDQKQRADLKKQLSLGKGINRRQTGKNDGTASLRR